ncbi:hypothetical protein AMATHDRAFT_136745 [Amanita thiersii Skay4041]|uniref:Proteasome assembly chaperone 2 n=1 Tax=Amanita thiersii Skay4041 TaxID=703135 RepID=A0A2A9P015_9AGAR|nr:hypothetical protein AMATHDRAFT_136745 [Amanita thiersii Skay4041]
MGFVYPLSNANIAGKTLVIPIISTANVSQLAADLLIATFSLTRLATFDTSYFIPVVGAREDGAPGITTPFELYGSDSSSFLVIQQRSPVLKSRKQEYVDTLLDFIKRSGVGAVLFLSGVDVLNRTDSQMFTPIYQIQPKNAPLLASTPLQSLNAFPIPTYTSPVSQHPSAGDGATQIPFIPGGGLTRRILSSVPDGWGTPTATLLQFVLEGDNRADAHLLAAVVAKVVNPNSAAHEWKQPSSWNQGLFGTPHEQTLYG